MAASIDFQKPDQPELAKHDASVLDLAFAMDCTGSMGSYIESARENIRSIVEEIVTSEKSDIQLALVEYRDHPPQEQTFVTRTHDFTKKVKEMKTWLDACEASGGGDTPEAVADALHAVLKLSWRPEATKICVLISDAPPHGLDPSNGDAFPDGDPSGIDPIKTVREMAEKQITLYAVGVEPPIVPYRNFFMTLAYLTGGQYVPMINAKLLAQVIIGSVREEISLERLMQDAQADIEVEIKRAESEGVEDEREIATRVNHLLSSRKTRVRQMENAAGRTSDVARETYSKCVDMRELRSQYKVEPVVYEHRDETRFTRRSLARSEYRRAEKDSLMAASAESAPAPEAAAATADPAPESLSYALKEEQEVSLDQAERIVQRMRKRR